MAEFFQSYKHLFEDIKDLEYTSQLKSLNHIVEQSRRERIASEKRRLLSNASDYALVKAIIASSESLHAIAPQTKLNSSSGTAGSGGNVKNVNFSQSQLIDSILHVPQVTSDQLDRLSFNKHGSVGGILSQQTEETTSFVGYQNQRNKQQRNGKDRGSSILSSLNPEYDDQAAIASLNRHNYPTNLKESNLLRRKDVFGREQKFDANSNIFQDPLSVPKMRAILLNEKGKDDERDQKGRSKARLGFDFQQSSSVNVQKHDDNFGKKKKYQEFVGNSILNQILMDQGQNQNPQQAKMNPKNESTEPFSRNDWKQRSSEDLVYDQPYQFDKLGRGDIYDRMRDELSVSGTASRKKYM